MNPSAAEDSPTVCPLSADARRVLGVLVEKAKTTPDNYPMTLAAIVTGANQKSNRAPVMDMSEDDAAAALDELRRVGAAREIQGSGRTNKFRHAAYEWLGVESPGASIMTELLLRGPQTLGELRTRAARMCPFSDLTAVQKVVDELVAQGLVQAITPAGRGQVFAHRLYPPDEQQYVEAKVEKLAASGGSPAAASAAAGGDVIDRILQRLDALSDKLDAIEQRLQTLEERH